MQTKQEMYKLIKQEVERNIARLSPRIAVALAAIPEEEIFGSLLQGMLEATEDISKEALVAQMAVMLIILEQSKANANPTN